MALKVFENLASNFFQVLKKNVKTSKPTTSETSPTTTATTTTSPTTTTSTTNDSSGKSKSKSNSSSSSIGSYSRKRRMSMKMDVVVVGKMTSSPTLTDVVTKKRSRLTSSMCELETAGYTADTNDDESNENVDEVKCLASPGSKAKAYRWCDFEMLRKIGSGGFGSVYLVSLKKESRRQRPSPNDVSEKAANDVFAMKIIDKRKIRQRKSDWRHLTAEHYVMTQLAEQHPFIVDIFCSFQTRSQLCYVLEFLQGGELYTWLQMKSVFEEDEARFYLSEIFLALEFLHSQSVIFRDLKPENLMLDKCGHVRLIDFGLAKVGLDYDGLETTRTICGTSSYMAPEVIGSSKKAGKGYGLAADWWSFGALAYDMMVGAPPFQGQNKKQTWDLILNGSLAIPPYFSPEARSLTTGLLQREPTKRLGHPRGGSIREHEFFYRQPNWWSDVLEKKILPPIVPVFQSSIDVSNFDESSTDTSCNDDENEDDKENCKPNHHSQPKPVVQSRCRPFENFSFVNEKFQV